MINIHFYMKIHELKQQILAGATFDREELYEKFESFRSEEPLIYNIETTNACNMTCVFCPRTTLMTREIEHLNEEVCEKIIDQIKPWTKDEWKTWEDFVAREYGIQDDEMSQNHFFLYIIPKVIVLHGFGDPLLDKKLANRVRSLTKKGIDTYFSCNPSNISVKKNIEMMEAGLSYLKYSIDSIDDLTHKTLRGKSSNYTLAFKKIMETIEEKEKRNLKTRIVITMIDLQRSTQQEEWEQLQEVFKSHNVYIYLKSQDQTWYDDIQGEKDLHAAAGLSVDWSEFCHFPWSSFAVKSNGEIAMCTEDYNNEIILGNAATESLYDIWNGEKYSNFRRTHFNKKSGDKCNMCTDHCDKRIIGDFLI
tara:strand:+ start:10075 stop:11163 length:1089 start_codon:yes stop_codon:yes gene_type:complete